MASVNATIQLCSTCKDLVGLFHCAGCKEIFCVTHCNEHRHELGNQLNQLNTELDIISQQVQEMPEMESLRERLYEQIENWKDRMIEKVSEKAEEIRRQADELLNMKDVKMREIQLLTNELNMRRKNQNFFEDDLQRIEENIQELRHCLDQTMQQSNIQLSTENIDWENLVSIKNKSNWSTSSFKDQLDSRRDSNITSNDIGHASKLWRPSMNSIYSSIDQQDSISKLPSHVVIPIIQISPNLSNPTEKRPKNPLVFVDPKTNEPVDLTN